MTMRAATSTSSVIVKCLGTEQPAMWGSLCENERIGLHRRLLYDIGNASDRPLFAELGDVPSRRLRWMDGWGFFLHHMAIGWG